VNAGSAYSSGGGFRNGGRHALEESMCVQSTLFLSLHEAAKQAKRAGLEAPPWATPIRKWQMHIPEDGAVLSPHVEVFRENFLQGYAFADEATSLEAIVSMAMPNWNFRVADGPLDADCTSPISPILTDERTNSEGLKAAEVVVDAPPDAACASPLPTDEHTLALEVRSRVRVRDRINMFEQLGKEDEIITPEEKPVEGFPSDVDLSFNELKENSRVRARVGREERDTNDCFEDGECGEVTEIFEKEGDKCFRVTWDRTRKITDHLMASWRQQFASDQDPGYRTQLERKWRAALAAAAHYTQADCLVLCDVGCGVFGNPASEVGAALKRVFDAEFEGRFEEVFLVCKDAEFKDAVMNGRK